MSALDVETKKPVKRGKQPVEAVRAAAAKRIAALTKSWGENSVALGLEFLRVRNTFQQKGTNSGRRAAQHAARPGWRDWIERNTKWSPRQVNTFIRVAERFGTRLEFSSFLSLRVLEFLAREHVPEEVVEEVIARAEKGEPITRERAEEAAAKQPRSCKKRRCHRRSLPEREAETEWQNSILYRADKARSQAKLDGKWILPEPPEPAAIVAAWQAADAWQACAEFLESVSGLSPEELAELRKARAEQD